MVEKEIEHVPNVITEIMRRLTIKISGKNLKNDLLIAEKQRDFRLGETDLDKINYILEFADSEIILEHEKFLKGKKLKGLKYDQWKDYMMNKFYRKGTKRDFVRVAQKKEESCHEYFKRVRRLGEDITEDYELTFEIALHGLFKNKEDIEKIAIGYREISDEFLEAVKRIEEITKEAYLRRKKA